MPPFGHHPLEFNILAVGRATFPRSLQFALGSLKSACQRRATGNWLRISISRVKATVWCFLVILATAQQERRGLWACFPHISSWCTFGMLSLAAVMGLVWLHELIQGVHYGEDDLCQIYNHFFRQVGSLTELGMCLHKHVGGHEQGVEISGETTRPQFKGLSVLLPQNWNV